MGSLLLNPPLGAFHPVDFSRFAGLWFEVARVPNRYQRDCDYATAEYTLRTNGTDTINNNTLTIDVVNTCYRLSNGESRVTSVIKGYARNTILPFALSVRFPSAMPNLGPINLLPNYIVSWVSEDYMRAVVLSPIGNVWFLSRQKHISEQQFQQMLHYVPRPLRSKVKRNILP